ncbi:general secretion pathway protein GspB [Noviherbaspirillum sp. CPCC 100848]|uniref:General secretion pathway protein GspB n=1 Tax=Noviherbaspirillum album TaxID=3080276 RepID=A0ABU6J4C5_9BURK|nr:general secretion pathway protein GspB [Noviherbaspirillum sp. CPCC 100848]MEC4718486.1 general secretion pathway protein GspB [Noviherbaspirillum sp. CPCC 100848]
MSYILDALKKAEAERHGGPRAAGPIPPSFHVHAQRQPLWRRPWVWSVLSAAAVVGAGMIWMGGAPAPETPAQATQATPPAPAASSTPAPGSPPPVAQAPAPAAQQPSPAPAAAPTPPLAQAPARAPEVPVEKPRAAERKPVEKKMPETAKPARKPRQEDTKAAAAPTTPEKPRPAPEPPVGTLRDLPAQIQQEVPQYSVGGYIYSASKADRSILINKRLLREGDEIAPGFKLETMTPSGMILNYKGYRYRASY